MLYLHIGTSKAGSTAIQAFLSRAQTEDWGFGQLACFGSGNAWKLAAASGTRNAVGYWVHNRKRMSEVAFDTNRREIWTQLADELTTARSDTFVASSEYLYRHYFNERKALQTLRKQLLAHFGDVRIILYLRDQRAYMRSLYAQAVIGAERTERDFTRFIEDARSVEALWNYRKGVELWAGVFGMERMRVIPFSRENFFHGDLISDFLFRISSPLAGQAVDRVRIPPLNVSPEYARIRATRFVNGLPINADGTISRVLRRLAETPLSRMMGQADFPGDHDEALLRLISDGNAWLNETLLGDFPVGLPVCSAER